MVVAAPPSLKIVIRTQRRWDGGLRVWSDDVPGLVLSHADPARVMADVIPAVEVIMTEVLGYPVRASALVAVGHGRAIRPDAPARGWLQALFGRIGRLYEAQLEKAAAPIACPA